MYYMIINSLEPKILGAHQGHKLNVELHANSFHGDDVYEALIVCEDCDKVLVRIASEPRFDTHDKESYTQYGLRRNYPHSCEHCHDRDLEGRNSYNTKQK